MISDDKKLKKINGGIEEPLHGEKVMTEKKLYKSSFSHKKNLNIITMVACKNDN